VSTTALGVGFVKMDIVCAPQASTCRIAHRLARVRMTALAMACESKACASVRLASSETTAPRSLRRRRRLPGAHATALSEASAWTRCARAIPDTLATHVLRCQRTSVALICYVVAMGAARMDTASVTLDSQECLA